MKDGSKVFLYNPELKKYLFVLRDDDPTIANPNKWSIIGGGIEDGEDPKLACKREVEEELNVSPYDISLVTTLEYEQEKMGKTATITIHVFKAKINADVSEIILTEGQKVAFFTLDESVQQDMIPKLRTFIEKNKEKLL